MSTTISNFDRDWKMGDMMLASCPLFYHNILDYLNKNRLIFVTVNNKANN